jgi:hypothetical protein
MRFSIEESGSLSGSGSRNTSWLEIHELAYLLAGIQRMGILCMLNKMHGCPKHASMTGLKYVSWLEMHELHLKSDACISGSKYMSFAAGRRRLGIRRMDAWRKLRFRP